MVVNARLPVGAALALVVLALGGCRSSEERPPDPDAEGGADSGELVFAGFQSVSEATLRRELAAEIERLHELGFRKADLDDLASEVERSYRLKGYHFARVAYEYSPKRGVIQIVEENRVVIDALVFRGNAAMSQFELEELLAAKKTALGLGKRIYVESEVRALRDAVADAYFERGFREIVVSGPEAQFDGEQTGVTLTLRISEGPQHVLESFDFSSTPFLDPKKLEARFARLRGSTYVPRLRLEVQSGVQELYAAIGHPFASVTVTPGEPVMTSPERATLALRVEVQPNAAVRVRRVEVRGNSKMARAYVRGRCAIADGDSYDGSKVRRSFNHLFRTGLFKSVDIKLSEPVESASEGTEIRDLVVDVVEGPTLEYFVEAGFGSYDLARAKVGMRERNLFGRALIGRAELLGSIRGAQATVGVTDPWFLRTEWSADLPVTALYREEPAYTIQELKTGLRLSRPIVEKLVGGAAYRFSLSEVRELLVTQGDEDDTFVIGAAGPFLEYDSRDDLFAPTRGVRSRLFGEIGSPYLGSELAFASGDLEASTYFEVFPGTVVAGRAQTEWIFPLSDTDTIPIQERLFNGGENSVRSFKEAELGPKDRRGDPRGGEVRNLVSVELRQRLWQQLSGAVFFDYGNVALDDEKPFEDFRSGVGVGLRYGLPIGPFRVDFALNPDKRDDDLWVIHFAVGMAY